MFDRTNIALTSRGIVCAYPLIRGTNYFDNDWMLEGVSERKLTHLMDFVDSAIFIKETGLSSKIGILAEGDSGSITALNSIFKEPYLFESCVSHNSITDLVTHMMEDIEERDPSTTSA